MRTLVSSALLVAAVGSAALLYWTESPNEVRSAEDAPLPAVLADASVLQRAYAEWKADLEAGPRRIEIGLARAGSHVTRKSGAVGSFEFDIDTRMAVVSIQNAQEELDAWLVANVDGERRSFMPEPGDECRYLGRLDGAGDCAQLVVELAGDEWADMTLDTVAITRVGVRPDRETLLVGQPDVFARVYGSELAWRAGASTLPYGSGLPLAVILPQGLAIGAFDPAGQLQALVDHGEKLFFEETFSGNGRTCGTCHPAENNFTLDPDFIATMDPLDPLFLAEFDPNLDSNQNGGLIFEQPQLMHQFALIAENLDGFGDLANRFVMRAVSHTFAQKSQLLRPAIGQSPPKQRLGWSGDGSPGVGTLREFAVGAVTQHFPKTLARVPGSDFVLPTSTELDALEAFQLALGRQEEFSLSNPGDPNFVAFEDTLAEDGKIAFQSLRCGTCHDNAGGNSFFHTDSSGVQVGDPFNFTLANGNFDTGVEMFLLNNPDGTGLPRPFDGGFGIQPGGFPGPFDPPGPIPGPFGEFGDNTFNTPSVVEFADTVPAFHNHISASTPLDPDPVLSAVLFYRTGEFANSSGGQFVPSPLGMSGQQAVDTARFLRAINSLQNTRNALRFLFRAYDLALLNFPVNEPIIMRGVAVADSEIEDASGVLAGFGFSPDPDPNFQNARAMIDIAEDITQSDATRTKAIKKAIYYLLWAEDDLIQ
jgi:mono/diheme cytochrome c family protein